MSNNTSYTGFTVKLALADLGPVLFFGGSGVLLGLIFKSVIIILCSLIVFLSGLTKALWKIILAKKQIDIKWMSYQMRIVLPIGFIGLVITLMITLVKSSFKLALLFQGPQVVFFSLGILGLIGMMVCAIKLDSHLAKNNLIEQTINTIAQLFFFLGLLCIYLN